MQWFSSESLARVYLLRIIWIRGELIRRFDMFFKDFFEILSDDIICRRPDFLRLSLEHERKLTNLISEIWFLFDWLIVDTTRFFIWKMSGVKVSFAYL